MTGSRRRSINIEVESLYLMSGGYDFTVILKRATMKEIAAFVSSKLAVIDEVQSTATHIVLVRYKDHGTSFIEQQGHEDGGHPMKDFICSRIRRSNLQGYAGCST